jgi:hypothetical protein
VIEQSELLRAETMGSQQVRLTLQCAMCL